MKRASWTCVVVGVAGAACGDDPACIEGVCPDRDETRSFLGPCRAGVQDESDGWRIDFEYDVAGRVTRAGRVVYHHAQERNVFMGAEWSYDSTGNPLQIVEHRQQAHIPEGPFTWSFDAQEVRISHAGLVARYDQAAFAFLPLVGIEVAAPKAALGLLQSYLTYFEWTVEGNRQIQRQLPGDSVGPLATSTYELDARGRVVSIAQDRESDGIVDSVLEYGFEGDRLVRRGDMAWTYDLGGNVVEGGLSGGSYREVYSYDCW